MELFTIGFPTALTATNLLYCFLGVLVGTFVGVLPGISGLTAVALLMPLTFHLDRTTALIMLGGLYYGAEYGGSTASILLNLPGTASNAVTCLDGYPMAQAGRAGPALFITTITSFVGAMVGTVLVVLLAPPLAQFALSFHSAEYFSAMLLGLVAAASIGGGKRAKSLAMVCIGVYSLANNAFAVLLVLIFGVVGYVMKLLEFEPAPLLIGFILGPMIEKNFRRALILTRGDYLSLLDRPLTALFLGLTSLLILWMIASPLIDLWRRRRTQTKASA